MFNFIRQLPDPLMLLAMIVVGTLSWFIVAGLILLWDAFKGSMFYKYAELRRENGYLKKELREERRHGRVS